MNTNRNTLILGLALAFSGLPPAQAELIGPPRPPGWAGPERITPPNVESASISDFIGPPSPPSLSSPSSPAMAAEPLPSPGRPRTPVQAKVSARAGALMAGNPLSKNGVPEAEFAVHPLSVVISDKLSGLDLEPPELRAKLLADAREFVAIRDQRAPFSLRAGMVSRCLDGLPGDPADGSPYCGLILRLSRRRHHLARFRHVRSPRVRRLARRIEAGDLDALRGVPDDLVLSAIKSVPDLRPLTALTDAALGAKECPSTALLTGLGQHVEQRMPEEASKDLAASLYQRAIDCGNDLHTVQAAYRLGLIRVWQKRYADAANALSRITANGPDSIDYRSRALYWRFYCAKRMNQTALMNEMRSRLLREYPLSLHALLVGAGNRFGDQPAGLVPRDSSTEFRSALSPRLNAVLRAAEALLSLDENGSAAELLGMNLDLFKGVESAVQLYGAVLMMRSGDTIRKFQLLALMIHENPDALTRPSLEMLYPIRRFDMVKSFQSQVDPWVVLSLIRQESAFNERARSGVGAIGLMQLMPKTARRVASVSRRQLFDPAVNIRVGVKYFSHLLDRFDGDVELALASYNAGAEKVDDWKKRYPTKNRLLFMDLMPYRETREYVASIARNYFWYLKLYGHDAFERSFSGTRNPASGRGFFVFSQFNPLQGPDLETPPRHPEPSGGSPTLLPVGSPNGSTRQTGAPGPSEGIALASAPSRF